MLNQLHSQLPPFLGLDIQLTIKAAWYTVVKFKLFCVFGADDVRRLIQPQAEIQSPLFLVFLCVSILFFKCSLDVFVLD